MSHLRHPCMAMHGPRTRNVWQPSICRLLVCMGGYALLMGFIHGAGHGRAHACACMAACALAYLSCAHGPTHPRAGIPAPH
eukprot:91592-Chlamydomonas_euryale.AAC.4